jgi:hypothetical protein
MERFSFQKAFQSSKYRHKEQKEKKSGTKPFQNNVPKTVPSHIRDSLTATTRRKQCKSSQETENKGSRTEEGATAGTNQVG